MQFLIDFKNKVKNSQIRAAVKVNYELLHLYWNLGEEITKNQKKYSWGDSFLKTLSNDLKIEFPNMKGFSLSNLKYIRKFYQFYAKSQQAVDQLDNIFSIPWGHHTLLISKCETVDEAIFYVKKTINNGWSRAVLLNFLDSKLYLSQGNAVTNFEKLLPDTRSDLAKETLKDPYNFDFLTLTEGYNDVVQ